MGEVINNDAYYWPKWYEKFVTPRCGNCAHGLKPEPGFYRDEGVCYCPQAEEWVKASDKPDCDWWSWDWGERTDGEDDEYWDSMERSKEDED